MEPLQRSQNFFKTNINLKMSFNLMGTDALEMSAILCDFKDGDEVIIPSTLLFQQQMHS